MCGIVGIAGNSPTSERLVDGLRRLEYRGYDSAGIAVVQDGTIARRRAEGKIRNLDNELIKNPIEGVTGIAHTRWATHGRPTTDNAHPHTSGNVAIVHNGIIENFKELRESLERAGHVFQTETDSEVIAHLIDSNIRSGMDHQDAFSAAIGKLRGAFGVAAIFADRPDTVMAAREGSPLAVGLADEETFIGSDSMALAPFTRQIVYLEEGDWCVATPGDVRIFDSAGNPANREVTISTAAAELVDKGGRRHFMEKEIHEQPESVGRTLSQYISAVDESFAFQPGELGLSNADRLISVACGTAYYAGATAKYWFERYAGLAVEADIASEFRYRHPALPENGAALFISQSGETADTLAALRHCKKNGVRTIGVVNVPESSIAREADLHLRTLAGPEIGVASTKAYTAQLSALACIALAAASSRGKMSADETAEKVRALLEIPRLINEVMHVEPKIEELARSLTYHNDVLYLGRGQFYPLALEGALKLKEIAYIHAEGYAAGELKHGPIALIEDGTPVIVVAPWDELFEKTISNVQEVAARGADVTLFTDPKGAALAGDSVDTIIIPECDPIAQAIVAAIPIQLLAYHTAVLMGTDVDQPRNLAKSVTVE
ncbi:glutamine--fructose-6-phosphate transaminase (isomerizing) [Hyphobacterium sp.]|uniref:glutamine--fructose-6-phosphate transaminase (isomerizing) n=1 Tax=Hyphobacterium sp. TaxID=2004662 RepID=UPI003BAA8ACB